MTLERWETLKSITQRFARELRAAEFDPQIVQATARPGSYDDDFKIILQDVGPLFESNTFGGLKHEPTP